MDKIPQLIIRDEANGSRERYINKGQVLLMLQKIRITLVTGEKSDVENEILKQQNRLED